MLNTAINPEVMILDDPTSGLDAIAKHDLLELLVSQVENGEGAKYGRDARKFAVDSWKIHTGEWPAPKGWKDPYAKLDKAAKSKPKTTKAKAKK